VAGRKPPFTAPVEPFTRSKHSIRSAGDAPGRGLNDSQRFGRERARHRDTPTVSIPSRSSEQPLTAACTPSRDRDGRCLHTARVRHSANVVSHAQHSANDVMTTYSVQLFARRAGWRGSCAFAVARLNGRTDSSMSNPNGATVRDTQWRRNDRRVRAFRMSAPEALYAADVP
jgi:hypothetical protein